MAWATMPTFTSGNVLTAAQMMILVGNIEETTVGIASSAGTYSAATGTNQLAMRSALSAVTDTIVTTTSTSYVTLAGGPSVTVTCGIKAAVSIYTYARNDTVLMGASCTFDVTGATTSGTNDNRAIYVENDTNDRPAIRAGATIMLTGMTPGSSTFELQYRRVGASGTATFSSRRIMVHPY